MVTHVYSFTYFCASGSCGHFVGNHAILRNFWAKYPVLFTDDGKRWVEDGELKNLHGFSENNRILSVTENPWGYPPVHQSEREREKDVHHDTRTTAMGKW